MTRLLPCTLLACLSLASACDGLREAIIDGATGFHLPAGEPDVWVKKIVEISEWPPETRAAFIDRSVTESVARYSWARVAEETIAAYSPCD